MAIKQVAFIRADAHMDKIQCSDFNGNNLLTLVYSALVMPISIAVYKYYLFYVDFRFSNIYKTSEYYGLSPSMLRNNLNKVYQIKVIVIIY